MPATFLDFLPLVVAQHMGPQRLDRIPEPDEVMDQESSVTQYNEVMQTQLSIAYAVGLQTIHRVAPDPDQLNSAIDVACGTGHFTLCLAQYFRLATVVGVDLSQPMLEVARRNAEQQHCNVGFQSGDATNLEQFADNEFDLATFNQAAHHLPAIDSVRQVLRELDRVTHPDGVILATDLVRLRTRRQTQRYVDLVGQDYVERGLPDFFGDFSNSMYAAWSIRELRGAVPAQTGRKWFQVVPRGLPTIQIIIGVPATQRRCFLRTGVPWSPDHNPVPPSLRPQWRLLQQTLALGRVERVDANQCHRTTGESK